MYVALAYLLTPSNRIRKAIELTQLHLRPVVLKSRNSSNIMIHWRFIVWRTPCIFQRTTSSCSVDITHFILVKFFLIIFVALSLICDDHFYYNSFISVVKAAFAPTLKELLRGLYNSVHTKGWPLNKIYLLNETQVGNVRFLLNLGICFRAETWVLAYPYFNKKPIINIMFDTSVPLNASILILLYKHFFCHYTKHMN